LSNKREKNYTCEGELIAVALAVRGREKPGRRTEIIEEGKRGGALLMNSQPVFPMEFEKASPRTHGQTGKGPGKEIVKKKKASAEFAKKKKGEGEMGFIVEGRSGEGSIPPSLIDRGGRKSYGPQIAIRKKKEGQEDTREIESAIKLAGDGGEWRSGREGMFRTGGGGKEGELAFVSIRRKGGRNRVWNEGVGGIRRRCR